MIVKSVRLDYLIWNLKQTSFLPSSLLSWGKKALSKNAHMHYRDFFDNKSYMVIEPQRKGTSSQRQFLKDFYEKDNEFELEEDSLKDVCTVFLWDGNFNPYFAASFFVTMIGSRLIGFILC